MKFWWQICELSLLFRPWRTLKPNDITIWDGSEYFRIPHSFISLAFYALPITIKTH